MQEKLLRARLNSICSKRPAEKMASRENDAARLANGIVSGPELAEENNFFAALDLASFHIVSIGKSPIHRKAVA